VHAAALAKSGRNLNGQLLPPLVSLDDPEGEPFNLPWGSTYYLPFGIYLIAGVLKVLPLSEAAVRIPSALLGGVLNVGLIFFVALALFRNRWAAAGSALTLALAPANLIISRQALDSVCQPPFILGGLWCLAKMIDTPKEGGAFTSNNRRHLAFAAGVILGCGIYAYITSIILMPLYLGVFWLIAWKAGALNRAAIASSIAGFALAIIPMALWQLFHPEAVHSLQLQYNRADPGSATLMQVASHDGVGAALSGLLHVYWSYYDPAFLFVQGGNARNLSTGETGVFLIAVAVLAPIGLYRVRHDRPRRLLLLIGLFAAAIPAAIKGSPYAIQRASGLLIFVSVFAGLGIAQLMASRNLIRRAIAVILIAAAIWQFSSFYRGYLGSYRIASARAYDPTAFRDAADAIIASDRDRSASAIFIPRNFYDSGAKWRFYTTKYNAPALWQRTKYFAMVSDLTDAPRDSIAVIAQPNATLDGWARIAVMKTLPEEPALTVLRRER
jgi:hypothetical protein